jgi:hypothetical protein
MVQRRIEALQPLGQLARQLMMSAARDAPLRHGSIYFPRSRRDRSYPDSPVFLQASRAPSPKRQQTKSARAAETNTVQEEFSLSTPVFRPGRRRAPDICRAGPAGTKRRISRRGFLASDPSSPVCCSKCPGRNSFPDCFPRNLSPTLTGRAFASIQRSFRYRLPQAVPPTTKRILGDTRGFSARSLCRRVEENLAERRKP